MANESSSSQTQVQAGLRLIKTYESGQLDALECPKCAKSTVSVFFTNPAPNEFKIWLVCLSCDFYLRVQNIGMPMFFARERIRKDLARFDNAIEQKKIFKRDPNGPGQ